MINENDLPQRHKRHEVFFLGRVNISLFGQFLNHRGHRGLVGFTQILCELRALYGEISKCQQNLDMAYTLRGYLQRMA